MKMRVDLIPENVSYILNKLKLAGFKSYIVGRAKDHALVNICAAGHLRLSDEAPRYSKTSY